MEGDGVGIFQRSWLPALPYSDNALDVHDAYSTRSPLSLVSPPSPFILIEQALRGDLTQHRLMKGVELHGGAGRLDLKNSILCRVGRF